MPLAALNLKFQVFFFFFRNTFKMAKIKIFLVFKSKAIRDNVLFSYSIENEGVREASGFEMKSSMFIFF